MSSGRSTVLAPIRMMRRDAHHTCAPESAAAAGVPHIAGHQSRYRRGERAVQGQAIGRADAGAMQVAAAGARADPGIDPRGSGHPPVRPPEWPTSRAAKTVVGRRGAERSILRAAVLDRDRTKRKMEPDARQNKWALIRRSAPTSPVIWSFPGARWRSCDCHRFARSTDPAYGCDFRCLACAPHHRPLPGTLIFRV